MMKEEANRGFVESQEIIYEHQNCSNSSENFSSDLMDDASSSSSSSSSSSPPSSSPNGLLYQLSDLMDQLPIKRGLSKFYNGKSESFSTLASVEKLEDLAKRENPYRKRIKLCKKSFSRCSPKATIAKKTCYSSRGCFSSSKLVRNTSSNLINSCLHVSGFLTHTRFPS